MQTGSNGRTERTAWRGASRFGLCVEYYGTDQARRKRWAVHVALLREKRNAQRILLGKPE
jgi:hypothetical protein